MKPALVSDTTKSAKTLAQNIAKQVAQEPLEILKTAGEQVVSPEVAHPNQNPGRESQPKGPSEQDKLLDQMKSGRRMEALNTELKDIRRQDLFADLQEKIGQGIEVPLQDYSELSMEQKQVLKAQMEAVKYQKQQAEYNQASVDVPSVSSKPSRRFGAGQKHEAEKQQTRVEKPVPPSG
jgi:hypothetical protein